MTPTKSDSAKKTDEALYQARQRVIDAMPGIIDAIIEKAVGGSYQHAKFLLDFAGGGPNTEGPANEESLAAYLLKELREEPAA